jgi:DNA gyrase inhibitor GyrI
VDKIRKFTQNIFQKWASANTLTKNWSCTRFYVAQIVDKIRKFTQNIFQKWASANTLTKEPVLQNILRSTNCG